ncbi:hypothetical protein C8Q76DRAFT_801948 [Earliella scabrosa]|nr:hypothetical protein C8Q76DRAFT_801948 [Earliella scabrosa]
MSILLENTSTSTLITDLPEEGKQEGVSSRKRDAEFWFEDGTIILIAQDIEFRVYKGLLASRFPVFSDMLSFPQPLTAQGDLQEDQGSVPSPCPTVYLSGDSARDWRMVFRLFMPKEDDRDLFSFFNKERPPPSFETLAACVRLGHKYHMNHLSD